MRSRKVLAIGVLLILLIAVVTIIRFAYVPSDAGVVAQDVRSILILCHFKSSPHLLTHL